MIMWMNVGDVTSNGTIPSSSISTAQFLAKQTGYVSGLAVATAIFRRVDNTLQVEWYVQDGAHVSNKQVFGKVRGNTRSLLIAERLVLNMMQRLSVSIE